MGGGFYDRGRSGANVAQRNASSNLHTPPYSKRRSEIQDQKFVFHKLK